MNAIELALEKQRLQMQVATQRAALAGHIAGVQPLFDTADRIAKGARWIRCHPEVVATGLAMLAVVQPRVRRFIWRWSGRGFFAWQLIRDHWHPGFLDNRWVGRRSV